MGGLARICKLYGEITIKNNDGQSVKWIYDYHLDKPRIESEMTPEEKALSKKAKYKKRKK